ncbi:coproporphyrinogen dehydrogenase HemZ [Pseudobacteroides cellulosolvens]|uniref:Coproporphyrinogen III oxidase n=1 Tax=Pseudobacteroides cellulosolvens ATCC 35603 = DSM 2933 TaxID=398512 RepID=A0A0L6JQP3_9FIRM|nr:coproporphyrinogen dehydrogenase HemZ [Pseudobacteroides cellulosolvens]KNY28109.1 Coproporphyrinogen III oxidase [Pseudobacteroides cellulosolvens ATCC 35603 = DSM 2933]
MICVKLEGHDFKYQVEDVIKLFFYNEDIAYVDEFPADFKGIFVLIRIAGADGSLAEKKEDSLNDDKIYIELWRDGINIYNSGNNIAPVSTPRDIKKHIHKKKLKMELKRQLYLVFKFLTGKSMPWGILTGIRPAKIVHEMLEMSYTEDSISDSLKGYYMVKEDKAEVLLNVAKKEKAILDLASPNSVSIYIGIPFCTTRCLYCSFTSNPISLSSDIVKKYMDALMVEMAKTASIINRNGWSVQSIYIGGGTPTSIDEKSLNRLLSYVGSTFDTGNLEEFTLEAGRPDSLNIDKLSIIKASRVDRISINPQSMNDDVLKAIGRNHTARDIEWAFRKAREIGFDNINMDIIAGLPGESAQMFNKSLERILELSPDSLTVHTLSIKRGSKLIDDKTSHTDISNGEIEEMVGAAAEYAYRMGMKPYYLYRQKNILGNLENIGYSTEGHESIYNIQIMEEKQPIIAMGAGAVTKMVYPEENRIERVFNVKSVNEYIQRIDEMVARKETIM